MLVDLPHLYSGKVRDIYDAGDKRLLMVTSDRMSAFDVVMAEPIPDKGRVLTAMSAFWFEHFADVVGNHLISTDLADLPPGAQDPSLAGRVMLCRKAEMLPIECIVRGYLTGSAWKEYKTVAAPCTARRCPAGLLESSALPEPVFTPSTKFSRRIRPRSATTRTSPSTRPSTWSAASWPSRRATSPSSSTRRGRRGRPSGASSSPTPSSSSASIDGELVVADEVLTPDSSRFWPADAVGAGHDAAVVRQAAGARLPRRARLGQAAAAARRCRAEVVDATSRRYIEAYERITGRSVRRLGLGGPRLAGGRRPACARVGPCCSPCTSK